MFEAYTNAVQDLTTNTAVTFSTTKFHDCRITNSGNTITLKTPGRYYVNVNAIGGSGTAGGEFTLQLYANGTACPEAISTVTSTAADDAQTLHFSTIINVGLSCPVYSNTVNLQALATSTTAGTLTEATIVIYKLR